MEHFEKTKKRETGDESISTKDVGFLYTFFCPAAHAFLPLRSIQAHTASVGQAGFASQKPPPFRAEALQTPPVLVSPNGPCAAPSQVPFAAPCRRRYNTLDLARQDRVPREALPPLDTPATKPRFLWILPASGELPLWTPLVRGTLFPLNPLAKGTNPVSLDASPQRKSRMKNAMLIPHFLCQSDRRPL